MPPEPLLVRLPPRARQDLEEIWLYTARTWSFGQADRYHDGIMVAISALARCDKADRRTRIRDGYLKYAVGMHVIFFRVSHRHLDVVRILHKRMDVERHL